VIVGKTIIDKLDIEVHIEKDILRFQVSVDDIQPV
jgi:hypothetical protein